MTVFNIHEAKTHFSKLLERFLNGEEVVIAKAGKPIARILPYAVDDHSPRVPGIDCLKPAASHAILNDSGQGGFQSVKSLGYLDFQRLLFTECS
jgi:prevent-host-death family protein